MSVTPRPSGSIGRRALLGGAVSGAAALARATPAAAAGGPAVAGMRRDDVREQIWARFGNDAGARGWAGADGTYSAPLPDGRIAWLFNDTFLGPVSPRRGIRRVGPVHTTIVSGRPGDGSPVRTLLRGTASHPLPTIGDPGTDTTWFWNGHGIVDGGALRVAEFEQRKTGDDHFGFEWIGTSIASFSLPDLQLLEVRAVHDENEIQWGVQFVAHRGHVYIYGVGAAGIGKQAHVARARAGKLSGAWQFWTGASWSDDPSSATAVADGVGASYGVTRVGNAWVLSTSDSFLGSDIYLHRATSPVGPFTGATSIYTAPEGLPAADVGTDGDVYGPYNIAAHPAISRPGTLLLSYNVNSTAITDLWRDIDHNRARFVEITWG